MKWGALRGFDLDNAVTQVSQSLKDDEDRQQLGPLCGRDQPPRDRDSDLFIQTTNACQPLRICPGHSRKTWDTEPGDNPY